MPYNSNTFYDMNVMTGTTSGAASAGMAEDVSDIITNISPIDTPLWSSMPKIKAHSPSHEWLADTLAAATTNANVEGLTATTAALTARTRYKNYCQILRKDFEITGTVEASGQIGIASETAYQKKKKLKELVRDLEWNLIQGTSTVGASGTARKMVGLLSALGVGGNSATSSGQRALTSDLFNGVWQSAWEDGANVSKVFCGASRKRDLALLVTSDYGTRYIKSGSDGDRVIQTVDIYEGELGVLRVVLDRFTTTNTYAMIDPEYWRAAILRPARVQQIAVLGDSDIKMCVCELTLEYGDPSAGALLDDIS